MEFYETVEKRHTAREFVDCKIDEDTIRRIVAAGLKAPSNDHLRDGQFMVIDDRNVVMEVLDLTLDGISDEDMDAFMDDKHMKDEVQKDMYRYAVPLQKRMFSDASVMIIPLLKKKTDILHPRNISDLNIYASLWCSIENILLAATAEGYGCSLRIPTADESRHISKVLGIPEDYCVTCLLGLGKPKNQDKVIQKDYDLNERIHRNIW